MMASLTKKTLLVIFFLGILPGFWGCGSSPEELFETAEFEMLQTNYPHASRLYQEIITNQPKSELAATARKRLQEIKTKAP